MLAFYKSGSYKIIGFLPVFVFNKGFGILHVPNAPKVGSYQKSEGN